jgi:hypothetical protein
VQRELAALEVGDDRTQELARLAAYLRDIREAWAAASPEHKNRLARGLFELVWIKNGRVLGVEPRPEIEPFFRLTQEPSEELSTLIGKWRSRGDSRQRVPPAPRLLRGRPASLRSVCPTRSARSAHPRGRAKAAPSARR